MLDSSDCGVRDDHLRVPAGTLRGVDSSEPVWVHAVAIQTTAESGKPDEPYTRYSVLDTLVVDPGVVADEPGSGPIVSRLTDTSERAHHATVYGVFVQSFAGEMPDPMFDELARRVLYLEPLGADCLWFMPILENHATHGHHVTGYSDTASDLSSREDFEALAERCHDAGIRVVFDLVINHTPRDHPALQFHSIGVPGYENHYTRVPEHEDPSEVDWDGPGAAEHYFNQARIPNLDYGLPTVRPWMFDVATGWTAVIDGFRYDVVWSVPHGFWKEVCEWVKANNPDFLFLNEVVPRSPAYHETEFDAHYDTTLHGALRAIGANEKPATALLDAIADARWHGFLDDVAQLHYIENHNGKCYRSVVGNDAFQTIVTATFTLPGAPITCYGQEAGATDRRGTMRWHDTDTDLVDFHRRLSHLHDAHKALRAGDVEPVSVSTAPAGGDGAEADRAVALVCDDGTDRLVVVPDLDGEPITVELGVKMAETDLLTGERVGASGTATDDGDVRVTVTDAVVFRAIDSSSH